MSPRLREDEEADCVADKRGPFVSRRRKKLSVEAVDDMWGLLVSERERERLTTVFTEATTAQPDGFRLSHNSHYTTAFPQTPPHSYFTKSHNSTKLSLVCVGMQVWSTETGDGHGKGHVETGRSDGPGAVKDGCEAWTEGPG